MRILPSLALLVCCLVPACDDPVPEPGAPAATEPAGTDPTGTGVAGSGALGTGAAGMGAMAAGDLAMGEVHRVQCGCAIESVGKCSEWIEVDGEYVPLVGELGLGHMPFCRKEGLRARVTGGVQDGKFVASAIEILPPEDAR